ncbi:hypothetical protein BHOIPH791_12510 [Bartonella henselae]|uniref:Uncharacterized protein n=2 Tax=Bartonella TaxID=773 RepID=A0A067W5W2_9HYPH|nr:MULTISPECIES: hypothetical protein [Bartonella]ATP12411.1 hypothetical protein BhenCHDE101_04475 [Bartonella henselae]ETS08596.1 hypothetical protein Q655_00866 [Bartonella henselae JK 51]ETS09143.1 hypothetical protein Q654_00913 [Bartonella henselae JK 50]KEC55139.1 hypothetical protein O9A_01019 [Bartonella koehlerae C-29]MDM9983751.1 hypothetical protein [Bartonella henselae]
MILWMKRNLLLTGAALAAFFIALMRAFHFGKKTEQQKQTKKALKAATTRLEIENEVNKKTDADVRAALSDWLRDP